MILLEASNPTFEGVRFGIKFNNGKAEVPELTDKEVAFFHSKGFHIHDPSVDLKKLITPQEEVKKTSSLGASQQKDVKKVTRKPKRSSKPTVTK